jgi:aryl-alcohol dehydrogenase-like predicted oxidoreductase
MRYRQFGRLNWSVSEIGYGMWGLAAWAGTDEDETRAALDEAVELGCNFFDTAWAYGAGKSERILGDLVRRHPDKRLRTASKIPPKNMKWPALDEYELDDVYPPDHIRRYTEMTLENLGLPHIDLMQFHVWNDKWAREGRWQRTMDDMRREGLISGIGISINRWEPANSLETLRTGQVDAVQVIYNIFDQAPDDELFPLCHEMGVAVIARVPFDEGSLTGTLTKESTWPEGDFRRGYFVPENLHPTVDRVEALKPLVPEGMTLPEMALRFILANPSVSTIIPGMRSRKNVRANMAASDAGPLPDELQEKLRAHRWDRRPASWSG